MEGSGGDLDKMHGVQTPTNRREGGVCLRAFPIPALPCLPD